MAIIDNKLINNPKRLTLNEGSRHKYWSAVNEMRTDPPKVKCTEMVLPCREVVKNEDIVRRIFSPNCAILVLLQLTVYYCFLI